jgi:RNA polymerase sigma-70 factor (ECF subfamily)
MGTWPVMWDTGALMGERRAMVMKSSNDFEAFFLENYDSVLATLITITGDRERAVDATQEAFIKASSRWSKVGSYDIPAAWVRRVAINASRDGWRSDRRRRRRESLNFADAVPATADDVVDDAAATELLACLPPRQREVATLFYVEDRSVSETAHILGVSTGTIKSQLADARERMRQHLVSREALQ